MFMDELEHAEARAIRTRNRVRGCIEDRKQVDEELNSDPTAPLVDLGHGFVREPDAERDLAKMNRRIAGSRL